MDEVLVRFAAQRLSFDPEKKKQERLVDDPGGTKLIELQNTKDSLDTLTFTTR